MIRRRELLAALAVTASAQTAAKKPMSNLYQFLGGTKGVWKVSSLSAYRGEGLEKVARLDVVHGELAAPPAATAWVLKGFTSNVRYATRTELTELKARQQGLDRPDATCAALIPIKKTAAWWELPQDDRRQMFEETSHHTAIGLEYLPAIARRLHHSRDLGEAFDFLTWFEFAPVHKQAFEELVKRLRSTKEWTYVEREVDIRLERA